MQTHYHRCRRCGLVFCRQDTSNECTKCGYVNTTDSLIKVVNTEPVESGWFKGEKYL